MERSHNTGKAPSDNSGLNATMSATSPQPCSSRYWNSMHPSFGRRDRHSAIRDVKEKRGMVILSSFSNEPSSLTASFSKECIGMLVRISRLVRAGIRAEISLKNGKGDVDSMIPGRWMAKHLMLACMNMTQRGIEAFQLSVCMFGKMDKEILVTAISSNTL